MIRFTCGNCRQEIVGSLPCLHCYLRPGGQPALTMLPAEPKVPTYQEMAEAIRAFAEQWLDAVDRGTPVDCELVRLAERLGPAETHVEAISEPAAVEMAPDTTPTIPETPYGPSRGEAWREISEAQNEIQKQSNADLSAACDDLDRLGEALAAMTVSRNEVQAQLALARITLQNINDWATMDPAAEPFGWIANETAAALEGKPDPLHIALKRWIVANEACSGMRPADLPVDEVIAICDEATAANDALKALACSVLGDGE